MCQVFFSLKIMCCHDDTCFLLNLVFLKPWANQRVFFYGNVFSSAMLMKLCICFGICLSSKWFHLKLPFFLFSNLGLIIVQQASIHILWWGMTSRHPISKMHIVGEEPGASLSALRCLSYLVNSFPTDVKHLTRD